MVGAEAGDVPEGRLQADIKPAAVIKRNPARNTTRRMVMIDISFLPEMGILVIDTTIKQK